jgi:nucleoside 2-deoxyribosyltransferase
MLTLYLAGPINGCTDSEALDWRNAATQALSESYKIKSPMDRDYRGREDDNVDAIVYGDLRDIRDADVLLVNAERPSWGTAMETFYAHREKRYVVVVCPGSVSPWLRFHSAVVCASWDEAFAHLREYHRARAAHQRLGHELVAHG